MKGNLVDIAVAFVMGGAFGKVVTSFTEGIVAPLIGMIGGADLCTQRAGGLRCHAALPVRQGPEVQRRANQRQCEQQQLPRPGPAGGLILGFRAHQASCAAR